MSGGHTSRPVIVVIGAERHEVSAAAVAEEMALLFLRGDRYMRQNAELLAALKRLVSRYEFDGIPNDSLPAANAAMVAIASAEESPGCQKKCQNALAEAGEPYPDVCQVCGHGQCRRGE